MNLTGVFLCAQAEAQQMIRQQPTEGKIINIASMSATIANCNASYDASKAGVVHMTRTLAAEWGRFNINVNCISPSYVLTPMHASTPVVVRQRIRELTPLGHVERPEDLYGAVIFLASAASNYVTGHDLMVDGGHTLNAWLTPLSRRVPPRVSPEEETVQLKHDLDVLGLPYDADGINPDVHPEIADAFKAAFGISRSEAPTDETRPSKQLARMMDLSAVRTDVDIAEVRQLAEAAKQYRLHLRLRAALLPAGAQGAAGRRARGGRRRRGRLSLRRPQHGDQGGRGPASSWPRAPRNWTW